MCFSLLKLSLWSWAKAPVQGNTQAQFYSLACKKSNVAWKDSFCLCVFNSIWKLWTKSLKNLDRVSPGTSWPWDLGLRQSDMFLLVINITYFRWYQGFIYSDTKSRDCGKTASQMKWEAEVVIFLSGVLLSTYWSTSFKRRQKEKKYHFHCLLFLLESCRLALPLRPNKFLLTVMFSGTLLQAAAYKGKLPTTPKYVLLLVSSSALHMLN